MYYVAMFYFLLAQRLFNVYPAPRAKGLSVEPFKVFFCLLAGQVANEGLGNIFLLVGAIVLFVFFTAPPGWVSGAENEQQIEGLGSEEGGKRKKVEKEVNPTGGC